MLIELDGWVSRWIDFGGWLGGTMMLAGEGVEVGLIWVGKGVHMMIDLGGGGGGVRTHSDG